MERETQIAKENIDLYYKYQENSNTDFNIVEGIEIKCSTHLATCRRWLGFLDENFVAGVYDDDCGYCKDNADCFGNVMEDIGNKIKDLKQAIKIYGEAGLK